MEIHDDNCWSRKNHRAPRAVGESSYHDQHPFHVLMNEGKIGSRAICKLGGQPFYYQTQFPIKDAAILSNCPNATCGARGSSASWITTARRR